MKFLHLVNSDFCCICRCKPFGSAFLGMSEAHWLLSACISYCLKFPPGPCFLLCGGGVWKSCQDISWLLEALSFKSFFLCNNSTNFQELIGWHMQRDPDKHLRSKSVQVLQTQTPHLSSLSPWVIIWAHGWSNVAVEAPVGSWTCLVSYQILWCSCITAQCLATREEKNQPSSPECIGPADVFLAFRKSN